MKHSQNSMDYYSLSATHLAYLEWLQNLKSITTISVQYTLRNESCEICFVAKMKRWGVHQHQRLLQAAKL